MGVCIEDRKMLFLSCEGQVYAPPRRGGERPMSETGRRLPMTEGEICEMYRTAKSKAKQVGILAELNATSKERIVAILTEAGFQVDGRATRYIKNSEWKENDGPGQGLDAAPAEEASAGEEA